MKCKDKANTKHLKIVETKNERIMISLNCEIRGSKKARFIREKEVEGLLSMIGKIPVLSKSLR